MSEGTPKPSSDALTDSGTKLKKTTTNDKAALDKKALGEQAKAGKSAK